MVLVFIRIKWVFLAGKCRVTEWGTVCGRWRDIRLGTEGFIYDSFMFLLMFLHTCLYGAMTASMSFFQPQTQGLYHLFKEQVKVHTISHNINRVTDCNRQADLASCVVLCVLIQARPQKSKKPTTWCMRAAIIILPQISKITKHGIVNKNIPLCFILSFLVFH
jgi:hypothetical protein